ncbi:MAG: type II toxin-antitoxin system RelE/ParE family toxin [Terriglobia bacterium]|jgi:toxin ParE1/3/4
MRIVWDPRAVRDLQEIREFIAADKPVAAAHVAERIISSIQRLTDFPLLGRLTKQPGIRALTLSGIPYVVYYHLWADEVEILAVFHGARRRFHD